MDADGFGLFSMPIDNLHKEFEDSGISDPHAGTFISIIKDKLADPGKFGGALTSGLLLEILTKLFGG